MSHRVEHYRLYGVRCYCCVANVCRVIIGTCLFWDSWADMATQQNVCQIIDRHIGYWRSASNHSSFIRYTYTHTNEAFENQQHFTRIFALIFDNLRKLSKDKSARKAFYNVTIFFLSCFHATVKRIVSSPFLLLHIKFNRCCNEIENIKCEISNQVASNTERLKNRFRLRLRR